MKLMHVWLGTFLMVCFFSCKDQNKQAAQASNLRVETSKPNIIYILADDLGYGDLSVYGQTKFSTPNIDQLAKEGLLFYQHYAGSPVCAPSRSALLTGLHTGYTPIRGNKEIRPEGQVPMPDSTFTLAQLLKNKGYKTGVFGKWGLGFPGSDGDPLNQGFDEFYGYNCQRKAHHYYPYHLWKNDQKILLEGNIGRNKEQYAPNLIHEEALKFIDSNKDKPFFLFYPSIIPHAELAAPQEYMDKFIDKFSPEKPFKGYDGDEDYRDGKYESQAYPHAAFAAMMTLLDDQVGDILKKVKDLGLEENTIIIFSSDNGPHQEGGADPDFFNSNAGFRGYKRDLYEGGIRVPMIVKWKGTVQEGSTTNHISAFWDVMPTIAEIISDDQMFITNGVSFLPTLKGGENQKQHDYLYWEFHELGGRQALLKNNWKLVRYNIKDERPYELYNLEKDPGELNDLANQFPEIVTELSQLMINSRTESEIFKFLK
ncbi:arylsulfatase [Paucihalobacter ruber]|uniref:Arylsulfatase n=1 Tax=Paucihalobacter ruber TaxID=2567861 RepID=A0A506PPS3_9FLAO|nr:arylsulfatase [Paucihalobacter ruber]TPV35578.1 arylsulfatase [Paucihalobacter ruber]